jgi:GDP-4-dehydro-6-deoxy-D-mannose reductase
MRRRAHLGRSGCRFRRWQQTDWKPDTVFHLAAQTFVPASVKDPLETFDINLLGTARVLESCRSSAPDATTVIIGSGDAYGEVGAAQLPIREDVPLQPRSPYAASKAAAEVIALQYARAGWLKVVVLRPFNHTGPGQSTQFAIPSFAQQIADIKKKRVDPVLLTGDLSARRDLTDVRDIVEAYRLAALSAKSGSVYNVCSGSAVSMQEIVDELIGIAGIKVRVALDATRLRGSDIALIYGDATALRANTGWQPRIPLRRTLADVLAFFSSQRQQP